MRLPPREETRWGGLPLSGVLFLKVEVETVFAALSFIPFKIFRNNSTQPPLLAQKAHTEVQGWQFIGQLKKKNQTIKSTPGGA